VLEKQLQQDQTVETGNAPIEDAIQHLAGYVAGLEQSGKCSTGHQARDEATLKLVSIAKKMERFRRTKERHLGAELSALGESVWKILIQLVVASEEPKNLSVADLSHRISLPKTTTLRYINILESKGYIIQSQPQADQFGSELGLTKYAQSIVRDTLFALDAL
tara:strand:- start:273 stop:761 length:489 start_codon:yes stop_codon:yes gene_type:complete